MATMQRVDEDMRLLSLSDLESAVETMALAFYKDPLWRNIYPDPVKRRSALHRFFQAVLSLSIRQQKAYGIGAPPVGVAVWDFPGQPRVSLSPDVYQSFVHLVFSPFVFAAVRVRRIFSRAGRMQKKHAPEPHFYLEMLGVRPDSQGRGLASKLIRPFLNDADHRGMTCYTETVTPENVRLYNQFGFVVIDHYAMPHSPLELWSFKRPVGG